MLENRQGTGERLILNLLSNIFKQTEWSEMLSAWDTSMTAPCHD